MFQFVGPAILGFFLSEAVWHPKRKIRKSLPRIKIWRLEIFPCIRFHGRHHAYHLHHWIYMPIILAISIPIESRFLDSNILRSFLVGGTLEGFFINAKARRIIYSLPLEQSDEYR